MSIRGRKNVASYPLINDIQRREEAFLRAHHGKESHHHHPGTFSNPTNAVQTSVAPNEKEMAETKASSDKFRRETDSFTTLVRIHNPSAAPPLGLPRELSSSEHRHSHSNSLIPTTEFRRPSALRSPNSYHGPLPSDTHSLSGKRPSVNGGLPSLVISEAPLLVRPAVTAAPKRRETPMQGRQRPNPTASRPTGTAFHSAPASRSRSRRPSPSPAGRKGEPLPPQSAMKKQKTEKITKKESPPPKATPSFSPASVESITLTDCSVTEHPPQRSMSRNSHTGSSGGSFRHSSSSLPPPPSVGGEPYGKRSPNPSDSPHQKAVTTIVPQPYRELHNDPPAPKEVTGSLTQKKTGDPSSEAATRKTPSSRNLNSPVPRGGGSKHGKMPPPRSASTAKRTGGTGKKNDNKDGKEKSTDPEEGKRVKDQTRRELYAWNEQRRKEIEKDGGEDAV